MSEQLVDAANAAGPAVRQLLKRHPGERIVFSAAATAMETTDSVAVGIDRRRAFRQRRGTLVVTDRRVFFTSGVVSAMNAYWLFLAALFIGAAVFTRIWLLVVGAAVPLTYILQRLPKSFDLLFESLGERRIEPISGMVSTGTALIVQHEGRYIQFVVSKLIDEVTLRTLGLSPQAASA